MNSKSFCCGEDDEEEANDRGKKSRWFPQRRQRGSGKLVDDNSTKDNSMKFARRITAILQFASATTTAKLPTRLKQIEEEISFG